MCVCVFCVWLLHASVRERLRVLSARIVFLVRVYLRLRLCVCVCPRSHLYSNMSVRTNTVL